ncbi:LamG domain-containing protein [Undibacterium sp. Ji83W]|uniref:LamG domain-containing protein n=1 Tax=Undibacterium sp. Ji83W TaxID=3413043 RepID=UPI003BF08FD8
MADQYFYNTPVLLPFNGANNSTSIENAGAKSFAPVIHGSAKLSTEQSVYGGSSMKLNGDSDFLTFPDISLGSGDWTIECWVYLRSAPSTYAALMVRTGSGGLYVYGTYPIFYPYITSTTTALSLNTWHHVCAVRSSNQLSLYVDGVALPNTATYPGETIINTIGADGSGVQGSQCYIDDLRMTAGVARYVGNFTPPGEFDATKPDILATGVHVVKRVVSVGIPSTNFKHPHLATPSRKEADLLYGGNGRISGVTKKKGPPDVAVSTRVRLFKDRDGMMIRETWSDPVTGAYVFDHISMDVKYTVLTYDHTHNFRAVVADNLTPELMP